MTPQLYSSDLSRRALLSGLMGAPLLLLNTGCGTTDQFITDLDLAITALDSGLTIASPFLPPQFAALLPLGEGLLSVANTLLTNLLRIAQDMTTTASQKAVAIVNAVDAAVINPQVAASYPATFTTTQGVTVNAPVLIGDIVKTITDTITAFAHTTNGAILNAPTTLNALPSITLPAASSNAVIQAANTRSTFKMSSTDLKKVSNLQTKLNEVKAKATLSRIKLR